MHRAWPARQRMGWSPGEREQIFDGATTRVNARTAASSPLAAPYGPLRLLGALIRHG